MFFFNTKMVQGVSHISRAVRRPQIGQYKEGTWTILTLVWITGSWNQH